MSRNILITLFILLIISVSIPGNAFASNNGIINGRIINETLDTGLPNHEVILNIYNNFNFSKSVNMKTDNSGNFVFNSLMTETEYTYEVVVVFAEITYYTDPYYFDESGTALDVELKVYDSTTDESAIKIESGHTIVSFEQGNLRITEYYLFVNETNKVFIGSAKNNEADNKITLMFPLPIGAKELEYDTELQEGDKEDKSLVLINSTPFLPGEKEVYFSYLIKPESDTYIYNQSIRYPMTSYNVLIQGDSIQTYSEKLLFGEPMDVEKTMFSHLIGTNLVPGNQLMITVYGLSKLNNWDTLKILILSVCLLMIAIATYIILTKFKRNTGLNYEQTKQQLITEIANLDDEYENGIVSEKLYSEKRARLKAELVKFIRKSGDSSEKK
jgi:hypothetical protein